MPAFWYRQEKTLAARLLSPLGWLYGQAATLHGAYRARRAYFAAVPVISVGNLVVGGAGKTPLTLLLAQHFAAQGHQVAIVSRGYGGTQRLPFQVSPATHTASMVGDEPLMLAQALAGTSAAVWIGRNRPAVVRRAEQAGATLILLDDGFQRRDVARQANILVIGAQGFGNGLCLPAGPLREPLAARTRASFAVVINEPQAHTGTFYGVTAYRLQGSIPAANLPKGPLVAFAGTAHPSAFFQSLKAAGATVVEAIPFPDHHAYTAADLTRLSTRANTQGARLITTAKDAPKLPAGFAHTAPYTLTGPDLPQLLTHLTTLLP